MDLELTYQKSIDLLKELSTKDGFMASKVDKTNYKRVWSRDGVVQGLAALLSEDKNLIETFKKNLLTLKKFQDKTGRIASNIDIQNKDISYGTLVGKVDATLWFVIGVGQYYKHTKDKKFLNEVYSSVEKAIGYLEALELNGMNLLYIPTGGDWADEYITHGYVLFDQLLYLQALKEYNFILKTLNKKKKYLDKKISTLKKMIDANYFSSRSSGNKYLFNKRLYKKINKKFNKRYALASFSSDGFVDVLDCFANSLILVFDIVDKKKSKNILDYLLNRLSKQKLKLLPAFWPPIKKGEYFEALKMNSLFEFKNKPYHFHNGGLWPLIQGVFIAGLITQKQNKKAEFYLNKLAEILEKDNFEFNEYYDSKNYKPCGIKNIGFSAAGFIIAYHSVKNNKFVFK